jgi:hypothetical protein
MTAKFNEDIKFKELDILIKMKLNELLKINYPTKKRGDKNTEIKDVYGIIYRIHCIPEDKSYIGQTFSHGYIREYITKKGILNRVKHHYNDRILDCNKDKPLYIAMTKYKEDEFEVFEEEKIYEKDIAFINQKEGEYMIKYNSLFPNGYNIEEIGKKYPKILQDLCEYYGFEIQKYNYIDKTRSRRTKDVCLGIYFGLKKEKHSLEKILELLNTIEIEKITLLNSNGFRIIVKVIDEKDNIRIYFNGSKEECLEFSKKISYNIIISPSFYGKDSYKYQLKLDSVLENKDIITTITGKEYYNESRKCYTYLVMISGKKNSRTQTLHRISFGGLSIKLEDSYKTALEFVEKIKKEIDESSIEYIMSNPI